MLPKARVGAAVLWANALGHIDQAHSIRLLIERDILDLGDLAKQFAVILESLGKLCR